jgi:hypothetical protein
MNKHIKIDSVQHYSKIQNISYVLGYMLLPCPLSNKCIPRHLEVQQNKWPLPYSTDVAHAAVLEQLIPIFEHMVIFIVCTCRILWEFMVLIQT